MQAIWIYVFCSIKSNLCIFSDTKNELLKKSWDKIKFQKYKLETIISMES